MRSFLLALLATAAISFAANEVLRNLHFSSAAVQKSSDVRLSD